MCLTVLHNSITYCYHDMIHHKLTIIMLIKWFKKINQSYTEQLIIFKYKLSKLEKQVPSTYQKPVLYMCMCVCTFTCNMALNHSVLLVSNTFLKCILWQGINQDAGCVTNIDSWNCLYSLIVPHIPQRYSHIIKYCPNTINNILWLWTIKIHISHISFSLLWCHNTD